MSDIIQDTNSFMRTYWKKELQARVEKHESIWKIEQAKRHINNYKL